MRALRAFVVVFLAASALTAAPAAPVAAEVGARPSLLFGAGDVSSLRAKVSAGVPAQAWAALRRKVDAYVTPGPSYVFTQQAIFYPDGSIFPGWRIYDGATAQNQIGSYLTDLAIAHVISGDTRYSDMAIQLLLVEANSDFPAWYAMDGVSDELGMGDLSKGMAIAWDVVRDLMTPDQRAAYIASVNRNARNVFHCLTPAWKPLGVTGNNWLGVCGGGVGMLALAIEGEPGLTVDATTMASNARSRVLPYLQAIYGQFGDGEEGFNYAAYGLHNALPFAFAWKRARGEDLLALAPGVREVPRWLALEQIPGKGGRWVNRNDSNQTLPAWAEVLPMFFAVRPDGLTAWDWAHAYGAQGDDIFGAGSPPAYVAPLVVGDSVCTSPVADPTRIAGCWNSREAFTVLYWEPITPVDPATVIESTQLFPENGLVAFRSGWSGGQREVVGTFEARHDGTPGGHIQSDLGHFNLLGYGAQWAVDSGYAGGQNNAGASGHNLVTISCAQHNRNGSRDRFDGITAFASGPGQVVSRADLRNSYSATPSAIPWADRTVFFSSAAGEPPVLAVADSVKTGGAKQYCWKMHTDATNQLTVLGHNFTLVAPNQAALVGSTAGNGTAPQIVATPYVAGSAPAAHTVLQTDVTADSYEHLAVMALQPQFQFGTLSAVAFPTTGGNYGDVSWPGGRILLGVPNRGGVLENSLLRVDGRFGKVTVNGSSSVLESGTLLSALGRTYVRVTGGGKATVVVGGGTVRVTSPGGLTCSVFSPATVTNVTVNGVPAAYGRSGNDITFAC